MLKKIAIGVLVLIALLGGGLYYAYNNLDSYIRIAVEKYGTAATRTTVKLDSVKLSLTSGSGSLGGLSVGSPPGFSAKQSLNLGSISVKLDTGSVRGARQISIHQVHIDNT